MTTPSIFTSPPFVATPPLPYNCLRESSQAVAQVGNFSASEAMQIYWLLADADFSFEFYANAKFWYPNSDGTIPENSPPHLEETFEINYSSSILNSGNVVAPPIERLANLPVYRFIPSEDPFVYIDFQAPEYAHFYADDTPFLEREFAFPFSPVLNITKGEIQVYASLNYDNSPFDGAYAGTLSIELFDKLTEMNIFASVSNAPSGKFDVFGYGKVALSSPKWFSIQ